MEKKYTGKLRCATCAGENFETNDDQSFVKCIKCGREYLGGYSELLEYNQDVKDEVINEMSSDVKEQIYKYFKDAFKGNKNIKFK